MNIGEKFLPVGTVVILKNGKKRMMITGFIATGKETGDKVFDYIGCLYPEGVISSDRNLLFDHDQIAQVFYMGYVDDEQKEFMVKLNQLVNGELDENGAQPEATQDVQPSAPQAAPQPAPAEPQPVSPAPVGNEVPASTITFDDNGASASQPTQAAQQPTSAPNYANDPVANDIFNSVPSSTNN